MVRCVLSKAIVFFFKISLMFLQKKKKKFIIHLGRRFATVFQIITDGPNLFVNLVKRGGGGGGGQKYKGCLVNRRIL